MKIIILAAGMGTRLNLNAPKCLTELFTKETILDRQLESLSHYVDKKDIIIVVGYKSNLIKAKYHDYCFVENLNYKNTNTAKSLLLALNSIDSNNNIIWLNGDVVFDKEIIKFLIKSTESSMLVNSGAVGEEEVKYKINKDGTIKSVSKIINNGLGEAVGLNKINSNDLKKFKSCLEKCANDDYFEKAIELLINQGSKVYPIDISDYFCCEIDTKEDLNLVNTYFKEDFND